MEIKKSISGIFYDRDVFGTAVIQQWWVENNDRNSIRG